MGFRLAEMAPETAMEISAAKTKPKDIGALNATAAFMRTESPIIKTYEKLKNYTDFNPPEKDYNVYDHVPPEHENNWELYSGVTTPFGRELRTAEINQSRKDYIDGAQLSIMAQLGLGIAADPLIFAPFVASAKLTSRIAATTA